MCICVYVCSCICVYVSVHVVCLCMCAVCVYTCARNVIVYACETVSVLRCVQERVWCVERGVWCVATAGTHTHTHKAGSSERSAPLDHSISLPYRLHPVCHQWRHWWHHPVDHRGLVVRAAVRLCEEQQEEKRTE